jgi:hypothetical protein
VWRAAVRARVAAAAAVLVTTHRRGVLARGYGVPKLGRPRALSLRCGRGAAPPSAWRWRRRAAPPPAAYSRVRPGTPGALAWGIVRGNAGEQSGRAAPPRALAAWASSRWARSARRWRRPAAPPAAYSRAPYSTRGGTVGYSNNRMHTHANRSAEQRGGSARFSPPASVFESSETVAPAASRPSAKYHEYPWGTRGPWVLMGYSWAMGTHGVLGLATHCATACGRACSRGRRRSRTRRAAHAANPRRRCVLTGGNSTFRSGCN